MAEETTNSSGSEQTPDQSNIVEKIIKEDEKKQEEQKQGNTQNAEDNTANQPSGKQEAAEKKMETTEPKGVAAKIPHRVSQRSSFRDLSRMGAKSIKHYTKLVNKYASKPFDMKSVSGWIASTNENWNANQVNEVLSVIKNVLCGDHDDWVFDADALIDALDFKLDFLESWNICGRQKMWNPVDTLLKTLSNLEKLGNALVNWDKRFLANLQTSINKFIQNLGLPKDLTECIVEKANCKFNTDAREGIPPELMSKIKNFLSADICKRSDEGVSAYVRPVEKAAMTPFVSGLPNYDRTTMYGFFTAILNNPQVDKTLVLEILYGCIEDKPKDNMVKLLELIAYLKTTQLVQNKSLGITIGGINQQLQKIENVEDIILDKVLAASEDGTKITTDSVLSLNPTDYSSDLEGISTGNAELILKSMADDFSGSKDVTRDFENIIKLIKISDKRFVPEKQIPYIAECSTLAYLADKSSKTSYKNIVTSTENVGGIDYLKIEDDLSLADKVSVIANLYKTENQQLLGL